MEEDEGAIRQLLDARWDATRSGDMDTVLALMADDVVFLTPGQEPFGKSEFEESAGGRTVKVDGASEIQELEVAGEWAWMRTHIDVTMTPLDGEPVRRSGSTPTILRKQDDGRWVLSRDANLLPA
jgi:uncharacterized protein (TIGR02246 family)